MNHCISKIFDRRKYALESGGGRLSGLIFPADVAALWFTATGAAG